MSTPPSPRAELQLPGHSQPLGTPCNVELHAPERLESVLDDPHTLAVFGFGAPPMPCDAATWLQIPLAFIDTGRIEVWRSPRPVVHGRSGPIRWSQDGQVMFGAIELDESGQDLATVTAQAYAYLAAFLEGSPFPRLLRTWNYLDAITSGEGDDERYRRFCIGRAQGMVDLDEGTYPAATCIGRHDAQPRLQLAWLSARESGLPLENPRQVSAYRYPRRYGPQPPGFARAMLPPEATDLPLLLSGTAAIVGHASVHPGSVEAQIDEIVENLNALIASARRQRPSLPAQLGAGSPLRVYLRDPEDAAAVATRLRARLPDEVPRLLLHAQICRPELRVEIEGVHGPSQP